VERVRAYLVRTGAADADFFATVDAEADEVGARVRKSCLTMPDPRPLSIFENVYAYPSPQLDGERERFAAYLDSFADEEVGA
jgi:pyruvate dehydrogenase E1 component alpha subunit